MYCGSLRRKEKGAERLFENIMAKDFLNDARYESTKPRSLQITGSIILETPLQKYIIIKLSKDKHKENLEDSRDK